MGRWSDLRFERSCSLSLSLWTLRCKGPKGPTRSTGIGPMSATVGVFKATDKCIGPVSDPTKILARRIHSANSSRFVGGIILAQESDAATTA